ncbi:MAG: hypothetical protein ACI9YT_002328 [Halobacteriales archaeon]|jgi:hypothetical protein
MGTGTLGPLRSSQVDTHAGSDLVSTHVAGNRIETAVPLASLPKLDVSSHLGSHPSDSPKSKTTTVLQFRFSALFDSLYLLSRGSGAVTQDRDAEWIGSFQIEGRLHLDWWNSSVVVFERILYELSQCEFKIIGPPTIATWLGI